MPRASVPRASSTSSPVRLASSESFPIRRTFAYDRKNRIKSHTHADTSNARENLWYDHVSRVWQRWIDNSSTEEWDLKKGDSDLLIIIDTITIISISVWLLDSVASDNRRSWGAVES